MKQIQKLIKENYFSIKKRGLINRKTTIKEFLNKIEEEFKEVQNECFDSDNENILPIELIDKKKLGIEICDVILVSLNFAEHFGIDIEKYLYQKVQINLNRED